MHFKVLKGTPLFDTLMGVLEQIKESKAAIKAICDEIGSDGASESHFSTISGEINACSFRNEQAPIR